MSVAEPTSENEISRPVLRLRKANQETPRRSNEKARGTLGLLAVSLRLKDENVECHDIVAIDSIINSSDKNAIRMVSECCRNAIDSVNI